MKIRYNLVNLLIPKLSSGEKYVRPWFVSVYGRVVRSSDVLVSLELLWIQRSETSTCKVIFQRVYKAPYLHLTWIMTPSLISSNIFKIQHDLLLLATRKYWGTTKINNQDGGVWMATKASVSRLMTSRVGAIASPRRHKTSPTPPSLVDVTRTDVRCDFQVCDASRWMDVTEW